MYQPGRCRTAPPRCGLVARCCRDGPPVTSLLLTRFGGPVPPEAFPFYDTAADQASRHTFVKDTPRRRPATRPIGRFRPFALRMRKESALRRKGRVKIGDRGFGAARTGHGSSAGASPHAPRRAAAQRPTRRDAAAQAARAAGLLLGPAVVGGLRDRADHPRPRPRRTGAAAPTPWLAAVVVVLLVIVVASYRQTCEAYPNGGGAYAVSRENLGEDASLVAASSLLIDYVLTVAVSVVAGVAAITSAVPALAPHAVVLSLGLRGRCCRSSTFAASRNRVVRSRSRPTGSSLRSSLMLAVGFAKLAVRRRADRRERALRAAARSPHTGGLLTVFLVLRAFASGCTALTGVEAVSNGVPGVRGTEEPQRRDDPDDHGAPGDHDVRGDHGAGPRRARAHGRGPGDLIGPPAAPSRRPRSARSRSRTFGRRRRSTSCRASRRRSWCWRRTRRSTASRCSRRCWGATTTCPTSSRTAATGSCSPTGSSLLAAGRVAADRRLQRRGDPADPALHPRRVPLVHAEPGGHGPPLGAADRGGRARPSGAGCGASRLSTAPARGHRRWCS